ncbi:MAG: DUF5652 family protein [Nanoarchaeota archaeon]|nr:hypothetical protein [Nanoarchaeota archaeon]MBU1632845.1 hypothetical protein [Nanoarchaeota archaeon]MBU1876315.1 hypothetical protein [Nanoarchaeota archaeon]
MLTMYELYQQPTNLIFGLLLVSVWIIIWKGLGLWYAARNEQKGWFIAILILNTLGLLPIIYLIWFRTKYENVKRENKFQEFVEELKPKKETKTVKKEFTDKEKEATQNKPVKKKTVKNKTGNITTKNSSAKK